MGLTAGPPTGPVAVAFKEWAGVADALAGGRQSIILRKGGIDEGPAGFAPEHPAFWLYPTWTHQASQGLKPGAPIPEAPATGVVPLPGLAVVEGLHRVDDPGRLDALAGLTAWSLDTVLQRYHYRGPGLWVLRVRVWVPSVPAAVAERAEYAGCRSWVPLAEVPAAGGFRPAMGDAAFDAEGRALVEVLGQPGDRRG